ncbi:TerB family tellurite resistance protein [Paracoccaceae bacterium]|nr:TerB family tellurite resistance protein [Paracoccaceae bacterium]
MASLKERNLAKAVAAVFWADEKDTPEEWEAAKQLFISHSINWDEAKALIEQELELLIDEDTEDVEESEEELNFGALDFGPGVDQFLVLCSLAEICCADNELAWQEIDILHKLAEAMNFSKEAVSAAIAKEVSKGRVSVVLEGS